MQPDVKLEGPDFLIQSKETCECFGQNNAMIRSVFGCMLGKRSDVRKILEGTKRRALRLREMERKK